MSESDTLKEAQDAYRECQERDKDNHEAFKRDIRFSRLEEQWPARDETSVTHGFDNEARLTINRLAPIIRQVVNDARQNKPAITVRPQDNSADPATAEIMTGLVRNIEAASDADIAYDTAVDHAVSGGFGYFRINTQYACDDNWDQDIVIERVVNPLAVNGDPYSTAADSSDWNLAFISDRVPKKKFERRWKGATATDWDAMDMPAEWTEGESITVAEYWTREQVKRQIVLLSDGRTIGADELAEQAEQLYMAGVVPIGSPRDVMSYKVTQRIMTGVEVLETNPWAGKYIPLIPVYGDEIYLENKRHLRSLIRSAIDSNRMLNYWASKTTQVVALAPKSPFIGEEGTFDVDQNWSNVNDASLPFLEYKKGSPAPQRQPFTGVPTGMMQEMMTAAEHIKAVTGIYDASLGARSNEVSGVAIRNRQMEGDTSTFHFIDNLSRAIRHGGRVLIDLIPKVYNTQRVIRTLGEDMKAASAQLAPTGRAVTETPDAQGNISRIYDLSVGKYDLSVEAGPSYTSRREETRAELVEIIRAVPDSAAILGPMFLRNCDWPGAQEAADKLEASTQAQEGQPGAVPAEIQQQFAEGVARMRELEAENAALRQDMQVKMAELQIKSREVGVKEFEAQTRRFEAQKPEPAPVVPATRPQEYRGPFAA